MKTSNILLIGLTCGGLVSCTQHQQNYALGGAAAGAAAGAILGDDSSDVVRGAAIGAAAGTGTAAYQENNQRNAGAYNTGGDYQIPQQPVAKYPTATATTRAGIVRSPHSPYKEVNVSNFKTGDLARDPHSKQIFLVP